MCAPTLGRQHQREQRSPHRRRALTQPHEASAVGEWGKPPSPGAVDNEATVPGRASHDRSTAPPGSPAGTHLAGKIPQHTCKRGVGLRQGEPWAPCCATQGQARSPCNPVPCQASFPSQPRAPPEGQRRRRKRKSQGSEVTSRTQTRQSSLSHTQPRATRLNVTHRWSCSLCPGTAGLPAPYTCPTVAATPR